jgi:pimeloyl-ACP methyl ester carboxylesterase
VSKGFEAAWPEAQARLAALSSGRSKVLTPDDAGHAMAQEQPGLVADAIRDALTALSG